MLQAVSCSLAHAQDAGAVKESKILLKSVSCGLLEGIRGSGSLEAVASASGAHVSVRAWQSAGRYEVAGDGDALGGAAGAQRADQGRTDSPQHRCSGGALPHVHRVCAAQGATRSFRRAPSSRTEALMEGRSGQGIPCQGRPGRLDALGC